VVKAAVISDAELVGAILRCTGGTGPQAFTWDVQKVLSVYPPKVVLAKLRSARKRGLVDGCGCGCRGDWEVLIPSGRYRVVDVDATKGVLTLACETESAKGSK
jgi:hypothetical protein